jgi:hypothetical protein
MRDVIEAAVLPNYTLSLRFEDGLEGVFNFADLVPFAGIFSPLIDPEYFAKVKVNPSLGTVCWPNGADLDPLVLYAHVKGVTITLSESGLVLEDHA